MSVHNTTTSDGGLRIWGTLICKNQGRQAINVMKYHFDKCNFQGFVFINNDSFDDTLPLVTRFSQEADGRVIMLNTNNQGALKQGYWKTYVNRLLYRDNLADVVFPVDSDMFWRVDYEKLYQMREKYPLGFVTTNYPYLVHSAIVNRLTNEDSFEEEYKNSFWRHMIYRFKEHNTVKTVLFREGLHKFTVGEGDHFATDDNYQEIGQNHNIQEIGCYAYEYPAISYDDYIRKIAVHGFGQMSAWGHDWFIGKSPWGFHIREPFKQLLVTGNIMTYFLKTHYLNISEQATMMKDGMQIVEDRFLVDYVIP